MEPNTPISNQKNCQIEKFHTIKFLNISDTVLEYFEFARHTGTHFDIKKTTTLNFFKIYNQIILFNPWQLTCRATSHTSRM